jgi:hypothetical protein
VDFFSARTLRTSSAWATGTVVDDDEVVEAAFERSVGTEPFRTVSGVFRRRFRAVASTRSRPVPLYP